MEDSNLQTKNNNEPTAITRYQWDQNWADQIVHNVPIAKVADELSQLKEVFGEITPQILVDSSRNKKSVFHHYFEWDDAKAANSLRLLRANQILSHIDVKIIKDGEPVKVGIVAVKSVPSYVPRTRQNTKKPKPPVSLNVPIEFIKHRTINELRIISKRLSMINASEDAKELLQKLIDELSNDSTETKNEVIPALVRVV